MAIDGPFTRQPAGRSPSDPAVRAQVRHSLDHLLLEAAVVVCLLGGWRTVTHLYWLGCSATWLTRAELTKLMYRLGQCQRPPLWIHSTGHLNGATL